MYDLEMSIFLKPELLVSHSVCLGRSRLVLEIFHFHNLPNNYLFPVLPTSFEATRTSEVGIASL